MDKKKIKTALVVLLVFSLCLVDVLWFLPLAKASDEGSILVVSEEKSFGRDVLPILSKKDKGAVFKKDMPEDLSSYKSIVIDGRIENFADALEGFEGSVVLINPNEDTVELPEISGELLITAEAGGALKMDKNAVILYNSLTGSSLEPNGRQVHTSKGNIALCITPAPVIMIGSLSADTLKEIGTFYGVDGGMWYYMTGVRLLLCALGLLSLLALAWLISLEHAAPLEFPEGIVDAKINNVPLFFLSRLLLIVVSILVSLAVLLGMGVFDSLRRGGVLFISYIIGCSLTTRLFYHFGMLGIKGKPIDIKIPYSSGNLLKTLFFTLFVLISGLTLGLGGFWAVEIRTSKLLMWAVVFALLTYGFISVMQDLALLQKKIDSQPLAAGLLLFPYIPLFLIAVIYIPLGEFYMTMAVLKLIVFTSVCLLLAKIIRDRTGSVLYAAVSGAFCLSFMVCCQNYI